MDTLASMFLDRVAAMPSRRAFTHPVDGGWKTLTWSETEDRVRAIAAALKGARLRPEERCGILATTSLEWILADLAIQCAGGATTTVYPASTAEECAFILSDSETGILFVENAEQAEKIATVRDRLPKLREIVVFGGKKAAGTVSLAEFEERGAALDRKSPADFPRDARKVKPGSLSTLIYTSGTTGRPKGVELTQDSWAFEGQAIDALGILHLDDHQYLWLPLAHSFGKVLLAAQLAVGFETTVDGRVPKLVENLAVVKPTFMAAAPRIFEKVHAKIVAGLEEGSLARRLIFRRALAVGSRVSARKRAGRLVSPVLWAQNALYDRLVFHKIRDRFGGRLRFFVSGSAPLSREIAEFFHACGILILEGYGLTESSAASFVNVPDDFAFGTVGPPLPGVEVRIAEDGEVLLRGRGIMRGYHKLPKETKEALDEDGWLHTGDVGELDEKGRLKITDRKKDLIKTSGGKYVAPQLLEGKLKSISPYVSQVVVHGDRRNYVTALVTLDEETFAGWLRERGLHSLPPEERVRHPAVVALIHEAVTELNATVARHEAIKKFAILARDLTVESGELTPSLKVRRRLVEERYRSELDSLYSS